VAPVYKLSASSIKGRTNYGSMLAGNTAYVLPGDFESIATVSVGSGSAANVEFTSIPSTYTHLQIRGLAKSASTGSLDNLELQFNADTGSNYKTHFLYGNGSTAAAGVGGGTTTILAARITGGGSSYGSMFGGFVLDILDYANTNKYKTTRSLSGHDENGSGEVFFESGLWLNTNAITSIKLYVTNFNVAQYSHFALYGIRNT
jgi:hypothetical protein